MDVWRCEGGLVKGFDEESGAPIVYEIISAKSKIIPHVKGIKSPLR